MTIAHFPTDETLLRYAAGTLEPGASLVLATHVSLCPPTRARLRTMETIMGQQMETAPALPLGAQALATAFDRLDARGDTTVAHSAAPPRRPAGLPPQMAWPKPLDAHAFGAWHALGPGLKYSRVPTAGDARTNVVLLRAAAGMSLPSHGHRGAEYTVILAGSYSDSSGRFGPGDFSEEDEDSDHQPVVDAGGECICLIAMEGRLKLHGLLGRLIQPFIGF